MKLLETRSEVTGALEAPELVPPTAPTSLGSGTTRELRESMARFSDGQIHTVRRTLVTSAIGRIDTPSLEVSAFERTTVFIEHCEQMGAVIDARQLGLRVPAEALAIAMGIPEAEVRAIVEDLELIVRSIGRGESATATTDEAAGQLMSRFADHPDDAVAAVSLLYQVFDSTTALLSSVLLAGASGTPRRNALAGTVRSAQRPVTVGPHLIDSHESVRISLEGDGLEFGHGLHRCPGVDLAFALVAGITRGLEPFDVVLDQAEFFADGRAATLPLHRR